MTEYVNGKKAQPPEPYDALAAAFKARIKTMNKRHDREKMLEAHKQELPAPIAAAAKDDSGDDGTVYCHPCSKGKDAAVFHFPPVCEESDINALYR